MPALDITLFAQPDAAPKRHHLKQPTTTIGRDPSNIICIKDIRMSVQHAVVMKREGKFYVYNLSRTNGLYLNDERLGLGPEGMCELRYDDVRITHAPALCRSRAVTH